MISATNPRPPRIPTTEATIPRTSASTMTVASTWRDEAPRVRSIPNSRVRWATVIENVLKIRNAPTNTEMPAKTSRKVVRKLKPSLMSADCSRGVLGAGLRLRVLRQDGVDPGGELIRGDALRRLDLDLVELALLAGDRLGLREREEREARATERHAGAEPADSRERVGAGSLRAADRDLLADLVALLLGGDRVDPDLGAGSRRRALDPRERVERLRRDALGELRRAAAGRADPVAVLVEDRDRGPVGDPARGLLDPVDRG